MDQNRKLKVFLCHSKDDKPKVRELYRRLVADGFEAWLDEEKLIPGHDWDLEIRKAVREADVVVVCLSNSSVTKAGYVQKEIRFALDVADEQPEGAIFLIPTKLEECQVPTRLNKWQWVNLFEEKGYEQLETSLKLSSNRLGIILYLPFEFEPQMVQIPAGRFLMGTTEKQAEQLINERGNNRWAEWEQPQHTVELSEYSIGKFPITNSEYLAFMHDMKYNLSRGNWDSDRFSPERDRHPVSHISWKDAIAYCNWLSEKTKKNYRLPTEAEWEKAARGERGLIYPWGNDFDPKKANTSESKIGNTTEVGYYSPQGNSPYGCTDMSGNVWEWCNDRFDETEYKKRVRKRVKDPQGCQNGSLRVLRGGSFHHDLRYAHCALRYWSFPYSSNYTLGFRVAYSHIKMKSKA